MLYGHLPPISQTIEQDMLATAGEVRTNSLAIFPYRLLYMDTPVMADKQRLTYIRSMRIPDAVKGIVREREREGNMCSQHDFMRIYENGMISNYLVRQSWFHLHVRTGQI